MKQLGLIDGDLTVGQSGHTTVTGGSRIRQDLALQLGEPRGTDRFHPEQLGSALPDYIGGPIDTETDLRVRSEASRVLAQYLAIQDNEVYKDFLNGARSRYNTADVVRRVNAVDVSLHTDAVRLRISLTTQAGEEVVLNRTVSF